MSLFEDIRSAIFPPICPGCGTQSRDRSAYFCVRCCYHCPVTSFPRMSENPALDRIGGRTRFHHGASMFRFYPDGRVQHLIHAIKYRGQWKIAELVGQHAAALLTQEGSLFDSRYLIIPVPLHPVRLRSRGFNQSRHFAIGINRITGWPVNARTLIRVRDTPSQTAMTRAERQQNLEGAFDLRHPSEVSNRDVLIVDDILTTGATLDACYNVLRMAGPASISFLTIGLAYS